MIDSILEEVLDIRTYSTCFFRTHKVPIGASHFESTITLFVDISNVTVTYDVTESVTASPVTMSSTTILLHGVRLREIVPRAQKFHRPGVIVLTTYVSSLFSGHRQYRNLQHKSNERGALHDRHW
jgi:hypothetical protein